jgi:DNA polymerase III epsilon subunit-like protein
LISERTGRPYDVAAAASYNASFDGPRIHALAKQFSTFLPMVTNPLCLLQRVKWFLYDRPHLQRPENFRLETICRYCGIATDDIVFHGAAADAEAARRVCSYLDRQGIAAVRKASGMPYRYLWAIACDQGGEVRIPQRIFDLAGAQGLRLESWFDTASASHVIRAIDPETENASQHQEAAS